MQQLGIVNISVTAKVNKTSDFLAIFMYIPCNAKNRKADNAQLLCNCIGHVDCIVMYITAKAQITQKKLIQKRLN